MQPPTLDHLRRQLRDRFPQAHLMPAVGTPAAVTPAVGTPAAGTPAVGTPAVGTPAVGTPAVGMAALPVGAIGELVAVGPVAGLGLWLAGVVGEPGEMSARPEWVLIDGADAFDPNAFSPAACSRVLWVRCRGAMEMLKAADLLVRDGNLPWLVLDAAGLPRPALRQVPAAVWWRLKQRVQGHGCRMMVLTSFPVVPCAQRRWQLTASLTLGEMESFSRRQLQQRLRLQSEPLARAD